MRIFVSGAFALTLVLAAALSPALARKASPMASLDTDHDGTVDAGEVGKSAEALFTRLDRDHDGSVDPKELQGRLSRKEFKAADSDNDGALTKDEFLSAANNLFRTADPDNDGTLDGKELSSAAGKALLRIAR